MFYSGVPVIRQNGKGQLFHLSFLMEPEAIDLSYLNSGRAPFVVDHVEDIGHTLGAVSKGWFDGAGKASVKFSGREEMQGIIGDIEKGVLANISMGVELLSNPVKAEPVERGIPHLMATKWRPFHLSVVSRGADHNAQFLSDSEFEVSPELLTDFSAITGAASEADNSGEKARLALQLKQRRFRVLGR